MDSLVVTMQERGLLSPSAAERVQGVARLECRVACAFLVRTGHPGGIVAEAERLLSVVQELDATLTANLARAERLRQSILKRAFEGKLV